MGWSEIYNPAMSSDIALFLSKKNNWNSKEQVILPQGFRWCTTKEFSDELMRTGRSNFLPLRNYVTIVLLGWTFCPPVPQFFLVIFIEFFPYKNEAILQRKIILKNYPLHIHIDTTSFLKVILLQGLEHSVRGDDFLR